MLAVETLDRRATVEHLGKALEHGSPAFGGSSAAKIHNRAAIVSRNSPLCSLLFAHLADVLAVPSELKAPTTAFEVPSAAIGDAISL